MIPHGVEVFIGIEPIDLRWGFDRLTGIVAERIGREARSGALFVSFGRRRELDRTELCLFYERLDEGTFRVPEPSVEGQRATVEIDERALDDFLDGVNVNKARRTTTTRRRKRTSARCTDRRRREYAQRVDRSGAVDYKRAP